MAKYFDSRGLLTRQGQHVVIHWLVTLLVSALTVVYNEVESAALSEIAVFDPCEPEIHCTLF